MRRKYVLKVWISTILFAPILFMLITAIVAASKDSGIDAGAFGFIFFAMAYGLVLSLPTFILIYLLFPVIYKKIESTLKLKLVILLIGLVCILTTFYLLYGPDAYNLNENYAALTFSILYSTCLTIFSFVYKVADKNELPIT